MPSPFPGMDPYLEDPGLWPDVHHRLISIAGDMLTEQLRPRYYARIEERVYVSDELDPARHVIAPDLRIVSGSGRSRGVGATLVEPAVDVAEPVEATTLFQEEIREPYVEVIDRLDRTVVAVIEVLSPTNKVTGARGRESYQKKRLEVMNSPSHFIEIDLLRAGERFPPYENLGPHDYRVHVSRVNRRPSGTLWPIRIEQRLPVIPIPLKEKDPDGTLDLQAVLATAYDRAAYDLEIDYHKDPMPALSLQQAAWADRLLKEKGLR